MSYGFGVTAMPPNPDARNRAPRGDAGGLRPNAWGAAIAAQKKIINTCIKRLSSDNWPSVVDAISALTSMVKQANGTPRNEAKNALAEVLARVTEKIDPPVDGVSRVDELKVSIETNLDNDTIVDDVYVIVNDLCVRVMDDKPAGKSFQERVRRGGQQDEKPLIQLVEIDTVECEADKIQAVGVVLVQKALDELSGRRGEVKDGKAIADRVRELAKQFGAILLYNDNPVYLTWTRGGFALRGIDSTREYIDSSPEFPKLRAHIKKTAIGSSPLDPSAHTTDRDDKRQRHQGRS